MSKTFRAYVWDKSTRAVRFPNGKCYRLSGQGTAVRISPLLPWRGKSERRQVIKLRRQARLEAA